MHFCLTCDRWHFIPRQLSAWNIVYFLAMSTNPEGPGLSLNSSVRHIPGLFHNVCAGAGARLSSIQRESSGLE